MPGLAKLAAAANVRDGKDYAAIEQAEAIRTKRDWHGNAVAAVAVKQQRRGAVERSGAASYEGNGNLRAVRSDCVESLADIQRRIVTAQDRLLFAQNRLE